MNCRLSQLCPISFDHVFVCCKPCLDSEWLHELFVCRASDRFEYSSSVRCVDMVQVCRYELASLGTVVATVLRGIHIVVQFQVSIPDCGRRNTRPAPSCAQIPTTTQSRHHTPLLFDAPSFDVSAITGNLATMQMPLVHALLKNVCSTQRDTLRSPHRS